MERFQPGESVLLVDSPKQATGWVVGVSEDGSNVDVRWVRREGLSQQVTTEPSALLRLTHESEEESL